MDVTPDMIDDVAELARLTFTEEEKANYVTEFSKILGLMNTLNEVDTSSLSAEGYVSGLPADMQTPLRDDVVTQADQREHTFLNAPQQEDSCFVVPKIMTES